MGLIKVSHSSIRAFQTCPRKYTYLYHLKRVPAATQPALQIGTFVHEALDRWWAEGPEVAKEWMIANAGELSAQEATKVAAVLGQYDPPRHEFEWVANEVPFEVSIPSPDGPGILRGVRVIGYADGVLIRKSDGVKVLRECKTTASQILGFGPFWERLAIDSQIGMYANAFDVSDIYYDVIRKPQLRPSKADQAAADKLVKDLDRPATPDEMLEAYGRRIAATVAKEPEETFQWRHIHVTPQEKDLAAANLYQSTKALLMAEKNNLWPMHTGSCSMYGSCQYLGVCCGRDDIHDPVRFRDKYSREEVAASKEKGGE